MPVFFTAFREAKPFTQLIFTTFVVLVTFFVFQLLAILVAIPIFGLANITGLMSGFDLAQPGTVAMLKLFQVFQSIGLFIVPPFILAWLFNGPIANYLSLDKKPGKPGALLVTVLVVVAIPFIGFTGAVNETMHLPESLSGIEQWMRNTEETAVKLTRAFLKADHFGALLFNLFMIAVLPALGEELLFRGLVQKLLSRITHSHHWGIWLAAMLFSFLHMQFYGFLPRMLLGAMFGYLLVWSGSIWLPIIAHFVNNAATVIALYLIDKGYISPAIEDIGASTGQWPLALVSLALALSTLLALKRSYAYIPPDAPNFNRKA